MIICVFVYLAMLLLLFLAAVLEYELFIYNLKKPRLSPDTKYSITNWLLAVSS